MNKHNDNTWLTAQEAAAMLGYNSRYMYQLVKAGKIPHHRPTGGRIFFAKNELTEWMTK